MGVSADSVASHEKFRRKQELPYHLLADTDHSVCEAYGVWGEKKFMGKSYMGISRTTFLIDARGKIARVFEGVKPDGHAEEVAEALKELR
jgi:thioredoxin-dependent peroxiredoxin